MTDKGMMKREDLYDFAALPMLFSELHFCISAEISDDEDTPGERAYGDGDEMRC